MKFGELKSASLGFRQFNAKIQKPQSLLVLILSLSGVDRIRAQIQRIPRVSLLQCQQQASRLDVEDLRRQKCE
jgi:hypothetical protein